MSGLDWKELRWFFACELLLLELGICKLKLKFAVALSQMIQRFAFLLYEYFTSCSSTALMPATVDLRRQGDKCSSYPASMAKNAGIF